MDIKREAPAPLAGGNEGKTTLINESAIASAESPHKAASSGLPILIAEWDRNAREVVRVVLDQYNGQRTINVRVWYRDEFGAFRPGRNGVTLSFKHLRALAEALQEALDHAANLGLIDGRAP